MEHKNTILSIVTPNGDKFNAELAWDASVDDLLPAFYGLLVAAGYGASAILSGMEEFASEHLEDLEVLEKRCE